MSTIDKALERKQTDKTQDLTAEEKRQAVQWLEEYCEARGINRDGSIQK